MSQRKIERPQNNNPRPKISTTTGTGLYSSPNNLDTDTEDILKELDIIEHPERYSEEQRNCSCLRPSKGGFR